MVDYTPCLHSSQHVSEILILKLCQILHTSFITCGLVRRPVFAIPISIREEHVSFNQVSEGTEENEKETYLVKPDGSQT